MGNPQYNNTGHNFELTLSQFVKIQEALSSLAAVQLNYKFVPLYQVLELAVDSVVDMVGWENETGQCDTFTARSGMEVTKGKYCWLTPTSFSSYSESVGSLLFCS